jgi:hypothetical protein
MGKRERRRRRERAKRKQATPKQITLEFPYAGPRIRVVIKADQPKELQEVAAKYWEIAEDGTWAHTVGSIGDQQWVAATVTSVSHAVLLNSLCVTCDEPIRVTTRSWAAKIGGKRLDRSNNKHLCPECRNVQRQEQEQEEKLRAEAARADKAREKEKFEEDARKIAEVLADEAAKESTGQLSGGDSLGCLLYLALVNHAAYRPNESLPSLVDLAPAGWTGDIDRDTEAILSLYHAHLVAIASESPRYAFTVSEQDGNVRFFATEVKWRLVGDGKVTTALANEISNYFMIGSGQEAQDARHALTALVEHMEVINIVSYLDGLLTKNYDYPEVPHARRQELAGIVKKGFTSGYTSGQMICFAWRAADSAAAWKERNARMGPPEASSAAVTILNNKIDKAIEVRHAIPEYEHPRWHQQPPALAVLRKLSADVKRIRDRSVIDACQQCDHQGLRETDGGGALIRCTHASGQQKEMQDELA